LPTVTLLAFVLQVCTLLRFATYPRL
jgi:hypothetical protein